MYEYRRLTKEEQEEVVEERLSRGYPAHKPPHPAAGPGDYLLTAACYEHAAHMTQPQRRDEVLDALIAVSAAHGAEIKAWVILPNHYHLLLYAAETRLLSHIAKNVHGATAVRWNNEDRRPGRKVWFSFTDRAIRSERHFYTSLNYVHYNPVKHGYAVSPYEWAWSSVGWYQAHYGRDWLRDCWQAYPVRDYGAGWDD